MKETIIRNGLELSKDGKRLIKVVDVLFDGIIPEGVEIIEKSAFEYSNNKKITLPSTVKEIGESAFASFELMEINIPDGVTKIGKEAFAHTDIKQITFPGSLKVIPEEALSYSSINRVIIEDGVEVIGKRAFQYCDELEFVDIPDSVKEIEEGAFLADNALNEVSLPQGIKRIGTEAFFWCSELHFKGSFPETLTEIGDIAFCYCMFDEPLILRDHLEHIGGGAFVYSDVKFDIRTERYEADANILYSRGKEKTISLYGCAEEIRIDNSTSIIGNKTFYGAENLTKVILPQGLTNIEFEAFKYNTKLETMIFPNSLSVIGQMSFFNSGLKEIIIPENVEEFSLAFAGTRIKKASILCPRVSDNAFYACEELADISFGERTKIIGMDAFSLCAALREVFIPEGIEVIESKAFDSCKNMRVLSIPSSVKKIDSQSFSLCESLEEVTIKGDSKEWGKHVFFGCKSLKCMDGICPCV